MHLISEIKILQAKLSTLHSPSFCLGLVPTMGALHKGHLSLITAAREKCNYIVVSIFVNPTQFGPNEDFAKYPRQYEKDAELLESAGVDILFLPSVEEMYPHPPRFSILPGSAAQVLCGKNRPGHFAGVGLVVSKLLNIVRPNYSFFGQKDLQQTIIIRQMVEDLNLSGEVIVCPIIREPDGLAMSSRNQYLSSIEREQSLVLYNTLVETRVRAKAGATLQSLLTFAENKLRNSPGIELEYFEIVRGDSLETPSTLIPEQNPVAVAAIQAGNTRLIDNMFLFC